MRRNVRSNLLLAGRDHRARRRRDRCGRMAVGLVLQGLLDPQGTDWGQVVEEGIQMLLEGIKSTEETVK